MYMCVCVCALISLKHSELIIANSKNFFIIRNSNTYSHGNNNTVTTQYIVRLRVKHFPFLSLSVNNFMTNHKDFAHSTQCLLTTSRKYHSI